LWVITQCTLFDSLRRRLLDAYDKDIWDAGRKVVSAIWDALGWIWHGNFFKFNYKDSPN
jgi:hypothetical protein